MLNKIKCGIEAIKLSYNDITDFKIYVYSTYKAKVQEKYCKTEYFNCCEKGFEASIKLFEENKNNDNVLFTAIGLEYRHTEGKKLPGGQDILKYKAA